MHDWPTPGSGEIPTPELVAAWAALDTVPSERISPQPSRIRTQPRPRRRSAKLARMHADNRATERWVLDKVCEIVARSGYADSVIAPPLGQIFDLEAFPVYLGN